MSGRPRISWVDRNKHYIYNGSILVNSKGRYFKAVSNRTILRLQSLDRERLEIKITKNDCVTAYDGIDLKYNQRLVSEYKIYKEE